MALLRLRPRRGARRLPVLTPRHRRVLTLGSTELPENKFLCLRAPAELGSRFGDWEVCWLRGFGWHRLYYLVMVVKIKLRKSEQDFDQS
jgi:hypothetical protein